MTSRDAFIAEMRGMFNEICLLHDTELVRLIGFSEDDDDYYYHVRRTDGRELHSTAVGWRVSLKGVYPRYAETDRILAMNHCPLAPEFTVTQLDAIRKGEA